MKLFSRKKKLRKTPEGKVARVLDDASIDIVLDVGANIGQTHEKLRAAGYQGKIVSFEPVPAAHAELLKKAQADPKWTIAPRAAVGDACGTARINVSDASDMSSILEPKSDLIKALPKTQVVEVVETPVVTIDSEWETYCPADARVFLKIDTQGFERQVLKGAANSFSKLSGIQMELSLLALYEGEETYLSYLKDLHDWGFDPYMIWETNFSRVLGRQLQVDVLFMRRDA